MRQLTFLFVTVVLGLGFDPVASGGSLSPDQAAQPGNEPVLPAGFPSPSEVLRSQFVGTAESRIVRARCERVSFQISDERTYPLVGNARMAQAHFKCTITTRDGVKVVYVDHALLIPAK